MTKLIRTIFPSSQEAELAKDYLMESGLTELSLTGAKLDLQTNEDNWIAAFEILTSLGGSIANDTELGVELDQFYRIKEQENNEPYKPIHIDMIDDDAYIDQNLGYGDYELIEPYVLERYQQLTEEQEEEKP